MGTITHITQAVGRVKDPAQKQALINFQAWLDRQRINPGEQVSYPCPEGYTNSQRTALISAIRASGFSVSKLSRDPNTLILKRRRVSGKKVGKDILGFLFKTFVALVLSMFIVGGCALIVVGYHLFF